MELTDALKLKDLQHKAFKLQREVMKVNAERKALTDELFIIHRKISGLKRGVLKFQKKDGTEGKKI